MQSNLSIMADPSGLVENQVFVLCWICLGVTALRTGAAEPDTSLILVASHPFQSSCCEKHIGYEQTIQLWQEPIPAVRLL